MPNFTALDMCLPEVAILVAAMVQARAAVDCRSWSRPQEPTGEEWWADVLADLRARKREQRTDLAVKQAFYRLADEQRETILVACSKCDWRAAFSRDELIASHGADYAMPNLLNHLARPTHHTFGSLRSTTLPLSDVRASIFPTEGRSRVMTNTRARSRACARGIRRSFGGASAASAIMNASIASPWHRVRILVGNGRNRCNVC